MKAVIFMPLDGILLNQVVQEINKYGPLKINRITQPSEHDFLIHCFAGKRLKILISTHPVTSRIQVTHLKSGSNIENTHLLTLLRKHLEGGIIQTVNQQGYDRVFEFNIDHRDDMGVIQQNRLIVELLGKYANVILINSEFTVIDSLKRLGSFENSQRAIVPGATYEYPPRFDKLPISDLDAFNPDNALRQQFEGVSPLLEHEITYRLKQQKPQDIVNELLHSDKLYIHGNDFHILELTHLNTEPVILPLMEGLDTYYAESLIQEQIKTHTGDLLKVIKREIKRSKSKLPKLYNDLENAQNSEHFKDKGELLFAYHAEAPNGLSSVTLTNWENEEIVIELDPKINGKANANAYFTKYRKAKTSLSYINKQIEITQERIQYFESLLTQTEQASVEDAIEIREELLSMGVLFQKNRKNTPKKNKKPHYVTINYDEDTTIFVGKNNLQNEYLTFKIAKKDDMWFHAANTFGAHVIIKTPELDEPKIRLCAHLAAYFSKARLGSSVEVYYTEARNIKKIPGKQPGMVRISTQKSIFIDPDEAIVHAYLPQ